MDEDRAGDGEEMLVPGVKTHKKGRKKIQPRKMWPNESCLNGKVHKNGGQPEVVSLGDRQKGRGKRKIQRIRDKNQKFL